MAKGYKAPKMGGQMGMMTQLQKLQEQMEVAQAQLAEDTVTATAGGGAIKVVMTGDQHCNAPGPGPHRRQRRVGCLARTGLPAPWPSGWWTTILKCSSPPQSKI
jgi:hypothetical protein